MSNNQEAKKNAQPWRRRGNNKNTYKERHASFRWYLFTTFMTSKKYIKKKDENGPNYIDDRNETLILDNCRSTFKTYVRYSEWLFTCNFFFLHSFSSFFSFVLFIIRILLVLWIGYLLKQKQPVDKYSLLFFLRLLIISFILESRHLVVFFFLQWFY